MLRKLTIGIVKNPLSLLQWLCDMVSAVNNLEEVTTKLREQRDKELARLAEIERKKLDAETKAEAKARAVEAAKVLVAETEAKQKAKADAEAKEKQRRDDEAKTLADAQRLIKESRK